MTKKYLILFFVTFFFNSPISAAGTDSTSSGPLSDGGEDSSHLNAKNSNYKRGLDALKQAKKYDKKGKNDKAKKRFEDTIKFFLLANDENPNEPDIFKYLGFSYKKAEDFAMAEIYYFQGLDINPIHVGINKYLGELYVETNRIDLANERLEILKSCNCDEYKQLKKIINGK